jgi:hypothetical protein
LLDESRYQEHNGRGRMFHKFSNIGVLTLIFK